MNEYQKKLNTLKSYGFHIMDDNKTVVMTTDEASKVYDDLFTVPKSYVLGSVPTENEKLQNVEYDIMFRVVEKFEPNLTKERYQELHKMAFENDIGIFLNHLQTVESAEVYDDMEEELVDWIRAIHTEVDEIIYSLELATQKNGQHN